MTLVDALFIILYVGALFVVFFFGTRWLKRQAQMYTKVEAAKVEAVNEVVQAIQAIDQSEKSLIASYLGQKTAAARRSEMVCVRYFIQMLQARADHVEILKRSDRETVLLIRNGENKHLLFLEGYRVATEELTAEKFSLDEFLEGAKDDPKETIIATSIRIVTSLEECDEDCEIGLHTATKEASAYAAVQFKNRESANSISLYEMVTPNNGHQSFAFREVPFDYHVLGEELANLSYEAVTTPIGDDYYQVPMGKMLEYYCDQLLSGKNILLLGGTGSGKSVLATNIVAGLLAHKVAVLRLDYTTLTNITSSQGRSALYDFAADLQAEKIDKLIMFVDEGQRIANSAQLTPLLEFMEGLALSHVQVSVLGALSQKKSQLDPALVREGRAHTIVELSELRAAKIKAAARYIGNNYQLVLNTDQLKKLEAAGKATLAQVWGCFQEKSQVSKWKDNFHKYRIEPPAAPPVT